MGWNEVRVTSWQELTAALAEALDGYRVPPTYLFRGQPDASWPLAPSLLRTVRDAPDAGAARRIEELLESEFHAQSALFPETESVWSALMAAGRTELWAHMQHHGCPTRLLDWTASAYVAAYFAIDKCEDRDGALFMVAGAALGNARIPDEDFIDPSAPERVMFTWPEFKSRRVVAQQGHFSVSTKVFAAHDGPILDACLKTSAEHPGKVVHRKIIIGADLKLVVLQQLRAMNIAPHALFPGLDGLGRSLADLARLAAVLARPPNRT
jgi:hypothetical protein